MYRPVREGRSCEHFGGYKAINRIPLHLYRECVWTSLGITITHIFFLSSFKEDLKSIEAGLIEKNRTAKRPYTYLLPSGIANSINLWFNPLTLLLLVAHRKFVCMGHIFIHTTHLLKWGVCPIYKTRNIGCFTSFPQLQATYIHTYIHAYIHTHRYIHTYMHIHTCTYMHTKVGWRLSRKGGAHYRQS